ncbi:MAG: YdcF family protein [Clostridia bacterium]|nr:YdcF family protein [Clostridia bacterium]
MHRLAQALYWGFGILFILYFIWLNVGIRMGVSGSWMWLVAGIVLCVAGFMAGCHLPAGVRVAWRCLLGLGVASVLALEGMVFSGMNARLPADMDAIIVLGARVNADGPSLALQHRIDSAAQYLLDHPDTVCIASGGQGSDEPMAEAEAIRQGLLAQGIPSERILMEEQSKTTAQNLRYSKALLPAEQAKVGIVTNNFHVFRALALARKQGYEQVWAEAAEFGRGALPHFMVREGAGLVADFLRGNL